MCVLCSTMTHRYQQSTRPEGEQHLPGSSLAHPKHSLIKRFSSRGQLPVSCPPPLSIPHPPNKGAAQCPGSSPSSPSRPPSKALRQQVQLPGSPPLPRAPSKTLRQQVQLLLQSLRRRPPAPAPHSADQGVVAAPPTVGRPAPPAVEAGAPLATSTVQHQPLLLDLGHRDVDGNG